MQKRQLEDRVKSLEYALQDSVQQNAELKAEKEVLNAQILTLQQKLKK
jgi:hypothetical protein